MARQLPNIDIDGIPFFVDVDRAELVDAANPANTIPFSDMKYTDEVYLFDFDTKERNLPLVRSAPEDIVEVKVPHMVVLDPEGMAEKHGMPLEEIRQKKDLDLAVDVAWLDSRRSGILPKINIAGSDFIVDMRLKELRAADNTDKRIDLNSLHMDDNGEQYIGFYKPASKEIVRIDHKIVNIPKGVVMLKIPNELKLDPLGVAREYGVDEISFLRSHPPQRNLQATVVPLSETGVPQLVERNRKQLAQKQNGKHLRPDRGRRSQKP